MILEEACRPACNLIDSHNLSSVPVLARRESTWESALNGNALMVVYMGIGLFPCWQRCTYILPDTPTYPLTPCSRPLCNSLLCPSCILRQDLGLTHAQVPLLDVSRHVTSECRASLIPVAFPRTTPCSPLLTVQGIRKLML